MLFSTIGQGAMLVWMLAAGAVMGIWYTFMALLRRILQAGFYLTLICDLAFGAGCAAIFIAFLVSGNYGRVRLYEILACLLGAAIFACAAAAPLKRLEGAICACCKRIYKALSENRLIKVIFR